MTGSIGAVTFRTKMKFSPGSMILSLCLLGCPLRAGQLAEGDLVPTVTAKDQFGQDFLLATNVQFLLVAAEMASAKTANQKLAEQGPGFLERHHAAYLMDIHTMPGVARFFAFPKLRRYPQRIVLVDSAPALAAVPKRSECLTVFSVTPAGRILKIAFWNPFSEPADRCFVR